MVYFDNAATTFPKPRRVINEVLKCIREYCGNPGRSAHQLSLKTIRLSKECNVKKLQNQGIFSKLGRDHWGNYIQKYTLFFFGGAGN